MNDQKEKVNKTHTHTHTHILLNITSKSKQRKLRNAPDQEGETYTLRTIEHWLKETEDGSKKC